MEGTEKSHGHKYLQDLIDKGDEITLDCDITLDEQVIISKDISIDGKGHTIKGSGEKCIFMCTRPQGTGKSINVTIENVRFVNGTFPTGGAIMILPSVNCTLIDCEFEGNRAYHRGGAIWVNGGGDYLKLYNCSFRNNYCPNGISDASGGAIAGQKCKIYMYNCSFYKNRSIRGGAVFTDGLLVARDCTFKANVALKSAGAISNEWGHVELDDCLFESNGSLKGGALYANDVRMKNCEYRANHANVAGAVFTRGQCNIEKCRFTQNMAAAAGAINARDALVNVYKSAFTANISKVASAICSDYIVNVMESCFSQSVDLQGRFNPSIIELVRWDDATCAIHNSSFKSKLGFIEDLSGFLSNDDAWFLSDDDVEDIVMSHGRIKFVDEIVPQDWKGFGYLNDLISNAQSDRIVLEDDILMHEREVAFFEDGIVINRDNLIIDGQGHTIDADGLSRIFIIDAENVTLSNIRFAKGRNCKTNQADSFCGGGAIYARKCSSFRILGCEFSMNYSEIGAGAIQSFADESTIADSRFLFNHSKRGGDNISSEGKTVIYGCTFKDISVRGDDVSISSCEVVESDFDVMEDEEYLMDVAFNAPHLKYRTEAVKRIADDSILLEIIRNHPDENIRLEASYGIEDPESLIELVYGDYDFDAEFLKLENIDDERILADIALNNPDPVIRRRAIICIDDTELFERWACDTDIFEDVRICSIGRITNQEILTRIAREDESLKVCYAALKGIEDDGLAYEIAKAKKSEWILESFIDDDTKQSILTDIAINHPGDLGRMAVWKVSNQECLAQIAVKADDYRVRSIATINLSDQEVLTRVVLNDPEYPVRRDAVRHLENQEVLAQVCLNDSSASVRGDAVLKLENQEVLEKIALTDSNLLVRRSAAERITDEKVLFKILMGDENASFKYLVKSITDNDLLVKIAKTHPNSFMKSEVIGCITDKSVLEHLSGCPFDEDVKNQIEYALEKVRACEIKGIDNQLVLMDIALTDPSEIVRIKAIEEIRDDRILFTIALRDPWTYHAVIENMSDDELLFRILLMQKPTYRTVRSIIERITDEELLFRMIFIGSDTDALNDSHAGINSKYLGGRDRIRYSNFSKYWEAMERINDDGLLSEIAIRHNRSDLRLKAVKKIRSEKCLKRVVCQSDDFGLSSKAISKIKSQSLLEEIYNESVDGSKRYLAVSHENFKNPDLINRAAFDEDSDVRLAAIGKCEDLAILERLSDDDEYVVGEACRKRLRQLGH